MTRRVSKVMTRRAPRFTRDISPVFGSRSLLCSRATQGSCTTPSRGVSDRMRISNGQGMAGAGLDSREQQSNAGLAPYTSSLGWQA